MIDPQVVENAILERLKTVIDPETGTDILHIRLVQDLQVNENGHVSYIFRPSSPLCPVAAPLAMSIIEAVREVPGVSSQDVTVVGYVYAGELNETLRAVLAENGEE